MLNDIVQGIAVVFSICVMVACLGYVISVDMHRTSTTLDVGRKSP